MVTRPGVSASRFEEQMDGSGKDLGSVRCFAQRRPRDLREVKPCPMNSASLLFSENIDVEEASEPFVGLIGVEPPRFLSSFRDSLILAFCCV